MTFHNDKLVHCHTHEQSSQWHMHYCMLCLRMLSMLTELYVHGLFVDYHAVHLHLCDQTQLVLCC